MCVLTSLELSRVEIQARGFLTLGTIATRFAGPHLLIADTAWPEIIELGVWPGVDWWRLDSLQLSPALG
ncbi:unnamed protein product [Protopolystoma xenopodis]|uniref:Uncharacterized protein n=1 Tax=Protopolystoma xenopodis TaxID=117903 RepID=A0A448XSA0_9PLAT|nr:unnamed protein product [Protopolystoma xenopodis]